MSGDGFLRRSFRKRKKKKDAKADRDSQRSSTTNFALAFGEAERLLSENRRLRQELEFERSRNRHEGNDFSFPPRNNLVSTEQQTEDSDVIYNRREIQELENENRQLRRKIQDLEEHNERNNVLQRLETKITSLQQQMCSSRERKEDILLAEVRKLQKNTELLQTQVQELMISVSSFKTHKDKQSWTADRETGFKDRYQAGFDKIKDLMVRYNEDEGQRFDVLEEALASEMKAHISLQKERNAIPEIPDPPDTPEVRKMSSDIQTFAWKLQSYMVTMDKVKHFSRALGVEPDDIERLSSKDSTSPRDVFWSALCLWHRKNKDKASVSHLHRACSKAGILDNGVMSETDRLTLENCNSYLMENLHPIVTLPYLRNKGLFDSSDVYYVTLESARPERCTRLLALLPLFGVQAFDTFCEALTKSGQAHLAETLEGNRDAGYQEGDTERTLRKNTVSSEASVNDLLLQRAGLDSMYQQDYIMVKILSTILAKSSHMEAMMMDMSGSDSIYSSLAKSERVQTL